MDLKRFEIIEQANTLGSIIWEQVIAWKRFERDTVGRQLTRAADSISANLSEAYGRFSIPDRKRFSYYARGSLCETVNWIEKAVARRLIDSVLGADLLASARHLSMRLNAYIKSLDKLSDHLQSQKNNPKPLTPNL